MAAPLVGVIVIVVLQGFGWWATQQAGSARDYERNVMADVAEIRYWDEVLTMSSRVAALSADPVVIERYHDAVPKLDAVLARTIGSSTDDKVIAAIESIAAANERLINRELDAIEHAGRGDTTTAWELVNSRDYAHDKSAYATGMDVALARIASTAEHQSASAEQAAVLAFTATTCLALALFGAWLHRLQSWRRSAREADEASEALAREAFSDPLTGLANRRRLMDTLDDQIGTDAASLVLIDLDHFKEVNDTLGHQVGDEVLVEIAKRLDAIAQRHDATVARLGGDEFAMVVPGTIARGVSVGHAVVAAAAAPLPTMSRHPLGASVGVAHSADASTPFALLQGADLALYRVKESGRGDVAVFDPAMRDQLLHQVDADDQLRRAVSQRQFVPWFQPVVDLESGHPVAIEALARWQHPDGTIIGPCDFVEPMERLGLLDAMSWSILEQALDALVEFDRTLGPAAPHNLAVNVTPAMLGADGAADRITGLLATRHIPPERLTLEIVETAFDDIDGLLDTLGAVRGCGIRIAVDDFGIGQSTLARLATLPVDILKIDKSFVDRLDADCGLSVIRLVANLALELGLGVVAEGIETTEQQRTLADMGISTGQGFLFAVAAPAHHVQTHFADARTALRS